MIPMMEKEEDKQVGKRGTDHSRMQTGIFLRAFLVAGKAGRQAAAPEADQAAEEGVRLEEQGDSGSPHDSGGSSTPFPSSKAAQHVVQVCSELAACLHDGWRLAECWCQAFRPCPQCFTTIQAFHFCS